MGGKLSKKENTDPVAILYKAARDGADVVVKDVLQRMSSTERSNALETKTKDGDQFTTPLIITARNGNLVSVKMLLRYKADVEARGTVKIEDDVIGGCTPLWAAAASGHLDIVKILIERNADVNGRTSSNSTPLRVAAYDGRLDIVSCLVENGADVNARNNYENTPLMIACYNGHSKVVSYLIESGANINLQEKEGNTALHEAIYKDHFEIAKELVALGALQLPNIQLLTPLLLASNNYKIDVVEYFITRPECTKEQRIEGLELLGGTIANEHGAYDIEKAFSYMKRGMEERFQDKSCPLLKKQIEPLEVYQYRKESQTLEELVRLEGDDHAIHMEGLIIRERILGTDNTALRFPIRYRGAVFADSGNFDFCIGLWKHAIEIGQRANEPITEDLQSMADLFGEMVHKDVLLRSECVQGVFAKLVTEYERQTQEEHKVNLRKEELEKLIYCALYLLMIYTKVQIPESKETADIFDCMRRFLRLNPRTRDGNTLLHLASWYKTEITMPNSNKFLICRLPCVEIMKLIMHAGCNVNAINTKGNSPLHLAVTFKPSNEDLQLLRDVLETLFDGGVHEDLVNSEGKTAMDIAETDEARRILSVKRRLRLKCIAARAVRKFGLCYVGIVPETLERFISSH
ncbi:protein fem-1 homolog B-like [Acropora millepora]|uniref:protein fem-1 homolog B-like n=1 Tax=Acropora millepora TaxID=45264 RepID=UPI001CF53674|nr:protein fem-1 homolog B-like [Acropora millepora]